MLQYVFNLILYVVIIDITDTVVFGIVWYWITKTIRKFLAGKVLEYYNAVIGYIVIYGASLVLAKITYYFFTYKNLEAVSLFLLTLLILFVNWRFLMRRKKEIMIFYCFAYTVNLLVVSFLVKPSI